eukprot:1070652-Rhodomonas_salina.1
MATAADAVTPDLNAVLTKMQQQQQEIEKLQQMVTDKDTKLSEFTATKSKEMQGLLQGIFRYLDELGVSPERAGVSPVSWASRRWGASRSAGRLA